MRIVKVSKSEDTCSMATLRNFFQTLTFRSCIYNKEF